MFCSVSLESTLGPGRDLHGHNRSLLEAEVIWHATEQHGVHRDLLSVRPLGKTVYPICEGKLRLKDHEEEGTSLPPALYLHPLGIGELALTTPANSAPRTKGNGGFTIHQLLSPELVL